MTITRDDATRLAGDVYKYVAIIGRYHALIPRGVERRYARQEYVLVDVETGAVSSTVFEPHSDDEAINSYFMAIENRLHQYDDIL